MIGRPPKWKYSFDTSAFIDSWRRYYPIDVFPNLWKFIEEKLTSNVIVASSLVSDEINYQEDELTDFINNFKDNFILPNKNVQEFVALLINNEKFLQWSTNKGNEADPFVVSFAKVHKLIVVSYENVRKDKNSIPAACHELGVDHFTFLEFLRHEKFKL